MKYKLLILIGGLLSAVCGSAMTATNSFGFLIPTNIVAQASVTLAWELVSGSTDYKLYYGVGSGQYTNVLDLGNVASVAFTMPARGVKYYFAVTDLTPAGLESGFSSEVTYTAPAMVPNPPPDNMKQPVVLTVQTKSVAKDSQWADSTMFWQLDADQTNTLYRLKLDKSAPMVAAFVGPMPPRSSVRPKLPPVPGQ